MELITDRVPCLQAVAVQLYDKTMDCRSTPAVRVPIQKMPRIFELEKSAVFTLRYAQLEQIKVNALCMVNSKTLHHGFLGPELKLYVRRIDLHWKPIHSP